MNKLSHACVPLTPIHGAAEHPPPPGAEQPDDLHGPEPRHILDTQAAQHEQWHRHSGIFLLP